MSESRAAMSAVVMVAMFALGCEGIAVSTSARVCVAPEMGDQRCQDMKRMSGGLLTCITARDNIECLKMINYGEADLGFFGSEDLNVAATFFRGAFEAPLELVAASKTVRQAYMLIHNASNPTPRTLCHPGFNINSLYPPAFNRPPTLTQRDMITDIESHIGLLDQAWEGACIPGQWSSDPNTDRYLKYEHRSLCSVCPGRNCDAKKPSEGTLSCLLERTADAAIVSDLELANERAKNPEVENLFHLCPDGSVKALGGRAGEQEPCDWGRRPQPVFLSKSCTNQVCQHQRDMWVSALNHYGSYILPPGTSLNTIRPALKPLDILKQAGYDPKPYTPPKDPVRFCVRNEVEYFKCSDLAMAAYGYGLTKGISCVRDYTDSGCFQDIYLQRADVLTLDGSDVYKVTQDFGFERLLSEMYDVNSDTPTSSYYAVAVVRANSNITQLSHLRGRKSCHTGLGKTAGWKIPVATLLERGLIIPQHCNFINAMAEFFSGGSCVPGAKSNKYNPLANYQEQLCRLCNGVSDSHCLRGSEEPFYSYTGAFRCLVHGGGDVAFIKHSTVPDNTDGHSTEQWAQGLRSEDFQLLCPNGGRAPVTEYHRCHLALVPAHEVVVSGRMTGRRRDQVSDMLLSTAKIFGSDLGKMTFRLFGKYKNQSDLLFKDSAVGLKALVEDTPEEKQRKEDYFKKLKELHNCQVRVCALEDEMADCEMLVQDMGQEGYQFVCVTARDRLDCTRLVRNGQVDLASIPGEYMGVDNFRIIAQMRDPELTTEEYRYKAVAVVRRSRVKRVSELRGKKSCHTGFGKTTGWRIPVAMLKRKGVISSPCSPGESALEHEIAAVASTFNRACVPGQWAKNTLIDTALKIKYKAMCSMCHSNSCDGNDEYAGYDGALRCLTEKNGDVAFSKLNTVREFFQNRRSTDVNEYGLLCPDDRVVEIDSVAAEGCFWAARPWDAYVAHQSTSDTKADQLFWALTKARSKGEEDLSSRNWYYTTLGLGQQFFDVFPALGNVDTRLYYGETKMDVVEAEEMCHEKPIKFCVTTDDEENKCEDLSAVLRLRGISPALMCVRGTSHDNCLQLLSHSKADIMSLNDVQRFRAQNSRESNLVSLLTEHYGEAEDSLYYLLAVVKKNSGINSVQDLAGKTSCQREINNTSAGQIDSDLKDCISGTSDFYSNYQDAIKCLVGDNKDVAFVKHATTTPLGVQASDNPTSYQDPTNFGLLCANRVEPLDHFNMKNCNLGRVPADVIVTRQSENLQRREDMIHVLLKAAEYFGKKDAFFRLFQDYFSAQDLMFRDNTTKLEVLTDDHYQKFVEEVWQKSCGLYNHHIQSTSWHID